MIVVVASEKGGTGKTTLATNLSVIRRQKGSDVLLVDCDPQHSASDFAAVRDQESHQPELTCSCVAGRSTGSELRKLEPKFDDIVVDVGGRDSVTLRSALLEADLLVIPFLPSQYDAWGIQRMDELLGEVRTLNPRLQTLGVMNKVDANPRSGMTQEASDIANNFHNIRLLDANVGYRVAFRRSVADGLAVTELKHKDKKAIQEMENLYKEVFKDA